MDYVAIVELALLSSKPRQATVTAKGKLKVATLGRAAFDRLLGPVIDLIKRNTISYKNQTRRQSLKGLSFAVVVPHLHSPPTLADYLELIQAEVDTVAQ